MKLEFVSLLAIENQAHMFIFKLYTGWWFFLFGLFYFAWGFILPYLLLFNFIAYLLLVGLSWFKLVYTISCTWSSNMTMLCLSYIFVDTKNKIYSRINLFTVSRAVASQKFLGGPRAKRAGGVLSPLLGFGAKPQKLSPYSPFKA